MVLNSNFCQQTHAVHQRSGRFSLPFAYVYNLNQNMLHGQNFCLRLNHTQHPARSRSCLVLTQRKQKVEGSLYDGGQWWPSVDEVNREQMVHECHHVCNAVTHGEGAIVTDGLLGACGLSESEVPNEAAFLCLHLFHELQNTISWFNTLQPYTVGLWHD